VETDPVRGGTHVGLEEGDVVLVERPRVLLVEQVIIGLRRHGVAAGSSPAAVTVERPREFSCVELVRCDSATVCPSRSLPFSVSFLLGKPCYLAQMTRDAGPSSLFDSAASPGY